ncbi:permease prefix domain 1-containing protein [Oscillospiraceae bacterium OttesenSCG-928-F05]|nr:permease prefix domain 1-containing protein [Oscillospiraceae bacterium OttesenSCG-928-F05]
MQKCLSDYLDTVCGELRGKALKAAVREELRLHVTERAAELEGTGLSPEEAAARTVERMGDGRELGKKLLTANRAGKNIPLLVTGLLLIAAALIYNVVSMGADASIYMDPAGTLIVLGLGGAFALATSARNFTLQHFLRRLQHGVIASGALTFFSALIYILRVLDDPSALGPSMSVALLAAYSGILWGGAVYILRAWTAPIGSDAIAKLIEE